MKEIKIRMDMGNGGRDGDRSGEVDERGKTEKEKEVVYGEGGEAEKDTESEAGLGEEKVER